MLRDVLSLEEQRGKATYGLGFEMTLKRNGDAAFSEKNPGIDKAKKVMKSID